MKKPLVIQGFSNFFWVVSSDYGSTFGALNWWEGSGKKHPQDKSRFVFSDSKLWNNFKVSSWCFKKSLPEIVEKKHYWPGCFLGRGHPDDEMVCVSTLSFEFNYHYPPVFVSCNPCKVPFPPLKQVPSGKLRSNRINQPFSTKKYTNYNFQMSGLSKPSIWSIYSDQTAEVTPKGSF